MLLYFVREAADDGVIVAGLPGAAGRGSEDRNDPSDEGDDRHQKQECERQTDGEDGQDAVLRGEAHYTRVPGKKQ